MLHRFERPQSIAEAAAAAGERVVGGARRRHRSLPGARRPTVAAPLLDITAIAGLRGIRRDDRGWTIGATTTWTDVVRADLPPLFDALKAAAREVGGVQIQNTGTVAGNLCNASPAADGTPVLLALGASVVLQSARGERELALDEFVLGSRRTARAADELVVAVRIPARSARARSAFAKLGGRRYLDDLDQHGRGRRRRRCERRDRRSRRRRRQLLGGRAGACRRSRRACVGVAADADLAGVLEPADLAPLTPIDDLRGSAAYRRDATATLVRRALREVASP